MRRPVDSWATDLSLQERTAFATRYGRGHAGAGPTTSPRLLQRHGLVQFDCRHELDYFYSNRDGSGLPHRTGSFAGHVHRGQEASTSSPSYVICQMAVSFSFSVNRTLPAYNFSAFLISLTSGSIGASSNSCTSLWCCWKHSCQVVRHRRRHPPTRMSFPTGHGRP